MAGNICRCGTYQRIRAAIKTRGGRRRPAHERASSRNVSRRQFLGGVVSTGAFVARRAASLPESRLGAGARRSARRPTRRRSTRASISASSPTARSSSSRTAPRWAPASARRCRMVAADELEADWSRVTHRAGHRRSALRRSEHRRLALDPRLLRRVPPRRRHGAGDAGAAPRRRSGACRRPSARRGTTRSCTRPSGRRLGYGALVPAAAKLAGAEGRDADVQAAQRLALRRQGHAPPTTRRTSSPARRSSASTSSATAWCTRRSSIRRCSAARCAASTTRRRWQVHGVQQTVTLDTFKPPHLFQPLGGVAVIADNTWAALKGRRQLKVEWNDGAARRRSSPRRSRSSCSTTVQQPGKVVRNLGNVDAEFAKGGKVLEATYYTPHGGARVDGAAGRGGRVPRRQGHDLGADAESAGGAGHGGRGARHRQEGRHLPRDAARRRLRPQVEAGLRAPKRRCCRRQLGKPVKVVWTREDDLQFDYYHTDGGGVSQGRRSTAAASRRRGCTDRRSRRSPRRSRRARASRSSFELGSRARPICRSTSPNIRAENGPADAHVRIGWFRAVSNNFHAFAAHSFADEMAQAAGRDSLEFLLDMLGPGKVLDLKAQGVDYSNYGAPIEKYPVDTRRLRRVLEIAGERSGWGKRKSGGGRGMGIAAHRSFNSYVASVVEVEVDARGARPGAARSQQVVDAGVIVNPDRVRAQMEGVGGDGASASARTGEITAADGRIQQSNFHKFQVRADERRAACRSTCTSSRATRCRPASASRACRRSCRRSATRSSPRPASASASCRSRRRAWCS